MKITIRIEHDKHHFIKKSFGTIQEAQEYLRCASVAHTTRLMHIWLNEMDKCPAAEGGAK